MVEERKHKIILIDFDDSFTYNIAAELNNLDEEVTIVPYRELKSLRTIIERELEQKHRVGLILGPGPGHPDDYPEIYSLLKFLEFHQNVFIFGICLGHQLYWRFKGHCVKRSFNPQHGQKILLKIDANWDGIFPDQLLGKSFLVQRYNSLFIDLNQKLVNPQEKFIFKENELMVGKDQKAVTYQFNYD